MARTVALQALEVTTRDDYAQRLKDHLKETSSHAGQVSRRIKQLGGNPETVSIPRPEGLAKAAKAYRKWLRRRKRRRRVRLTRCGDRGSRRRCSATREPSIGTRRRRSRCTR